MSITSPPYVMIKSPKPLPAEDVSFTLSWPSSFLNAVRMALWLASVRAALRGKVGTRRRMLCGFVCRTGLGKKNHENIHGGKFFPLRYCVAVDLRLLATAFSGLALFHAARNALLFSFRSGVEVLRLRVPDASRQ